MSQPVEDASSDADTVESVNAAPKESEAEFLRRLESERKTVGVGMLSSRYQRLEVNLTGKQRGPDAFYKSHAYGTAPTLQVSTPLPSDRRAEYQRFLPNDQQTPRKELGKLLLRQRDGSNNWHARAFSQHTPRRLGFSINQEGRDMLADFGMLTGPSALTDAMLREAPNPLRAVQSARAQTAPRASPLRIQAPGSARGGEATAYQTGRLASR